MSVPATLKDDTPSARRWRLWVDGCGGFLLLPGNRWTVGGWNAQSPPDVCVRADWPRHAGAIDREGADYFWQSSDLDRPRHLITPGQRLPIRGSAQMTLNCPSPLSTSATLSVSAPHRLDGHVDGAILVNETLLVGPTGDCHIRATEFPTRAVLVCRAGQWQAKADGDSGFSQLSPGERTTLNTLAMTLEEA